MTREKNLEERSTSALIMLTAKAAEGCESCLEGYKRMASTAGVSEKDINFAISIGRRTHKQLLNASSQKVLSKEDLLASQADATMEIVKGKEAEDYYEQVLQDENVRVLDKHFKALGYTPVENARGMAKLIQGERECVQAYLPYQLNKDRFGWIDFHTGRAGVDLVGAFADLSKQDIANGEPLTIDSVIVEDNLVVSGHACDTNSFFNNLEICCGPSAVSCITAGPAWWACAVTVCGVCATIACFQAGCC